MPASPGEPGSLHGGSRQEGLPRSLDGITPAMAAGVTSEQWALEDFLAAI